MSEILTKVHKQYLRIINENQILQLPRHAIVLSTGIQDNRLCLWYWFETRDENDLRDRKFKVLFTGVETNMWVSEFIGTVIQETKDPMLPFLVMHVFEVQ